MNRHEHRALRKIARRLRRTLGSRGYGAYLLSVQERRDRYLSSHDERGLAALRAEYRGALGEMDAAQKILASAKAREAKAQGLRELIEFLAVAGIKYNPRTGTLKQSRPTYRPVAPRHSYA